jgi:hypothetical protein
VFEWGVEIRNDRFQQTNKPTNKQTNKQGFHISRLVKIRTEVKQLRKALSDTGAAAKGHRHGHSPDNNTPQSSIQMKFD